MVYYIDPGTGSMLFAILIGIIGAASYLLKSWFAKLKFYLSGGKKVEKNKEKIPFVIFSDDKRYWNVFEPVCRELDSRGIELVYMTASPDDPALNNPYPNIKAEFIGEGNRAFAKLNNLNAEIVLSTTPGLDVYQWKRSKDVSYYVHMLHGPNEVAGYRMFGIDYYDALLLSGDYQVSDVRLLEKQRNLPPKQLELIGVPYMDEMVARLQKSGKRESEEINVILAPTWGPSSIFNKYGERLLDELVKTGYNIIVRPHPQSYKSETELMTKFMSKYPNNDKFEWNRDNDNFEVLKRADVLITDFSGIVFEFSLVFDKPVICADTEFDPGPYDAWWLKKPFWTMTALPRLGPILNEDNIKTIKGIIDSSITDSKYIRGRAEVSAETWAHKGEGAKRAADYLISKYMELTEKEGN